MPTTEPILWHAAGTKERIAVCELCGMTTQASKRIALQNWEQLSTTTVIIDLIRHGIQP